jgi:hypothetical protein
VGVLLGVNVVGLPLIVAMGAALGLSVEVDAVGDLLWLADGLPVVVSFIGSGSQTVSLYVIVARVLQPALVELKNPINFQNGRMVELKSLQRYGRTKLPAAPWPGNLVPKDGVK